METNRRDLLRVHTAGTMSPQHSHGDVMAGPFEAGAADGLIPADKKLDPVWVKSLFGRGERTVSRGADLTYIGMPVGGLCSGQLYLGGDGSLWHWDIFNRVSNSGGSGPHYAHPPQPDSPVVQGYILQLTDAGGTQTRPLSAGGFADVRFCGEYPIGTVDYADPACPVCVRMEAFSPFIPLNTDDSSLPATVMRFTLRNTSRAAVEATLTGRLQNAVCPDVPSRRALRRNRIHRRTGMTFLNCSAEPAPVAASAEAARADIVFEDWDKDGFAGWTVEGTAFGSRPARREDIAALMGEVGGYGGSLASSYPFAPGDTGAAKDAATGKLTSLPFTIERSFISFWMGGGSHPGRTCVNLVVDGKVVRTATGVDSNRVAPQSLDIIELRGKTGVIEIVDDEKGDWGHVSVGRITFSDTPAPGAAALQELGSYGTMGLALLGPPADNAAASETGAGDDAVVSLDGLLVGALSRKLRLEAGETAAVDYVVAWHFPNLELGRLGKVGRHYAARFGSAQDVAQYVTDHFERLAVQTRLWRDTWYDSTLPFWFLDRTFLNTSVLASSTCHRFRDGRFYAWEGVGCCTGTCTHVWHYAQAVARLFPELERDTRERVDLGISFHAETGVIGFRGEFDRELAVDGQAGTILRFLREHQMTADGAFLSRNWARIKQAFVPLFALDGDEDGILEGAQMNTLDTPWYGRIAWLSSLYVAALQAGETMAGELGDDKFATHCRAVAERGGRNIVGQLFEGEYFINRTDPANPDKINSGTGCEIDQVFGQSWAFQVGLGRVLPEQETRQALRALWKHNFTLDVGPYRAAHPSGRWYAMAGEGGLLMCTFPRRDWDFDRARGQGDSNFAGYFNECMNGYEYQVAGHMIWEGMTLEGLAVTRAIHDRYHASRRNPWNEIECGDHYARSMASYGVFLAACGFEHHGPQGHVGFAPRLTPENFRAPFTTAEGWGTFSQTITDGALKAEMTLKWGKLRLLSVALEVTESFTPSSAAVLVDGKAVPASLSLTGRRATVTLDAAVEINSNETVELLLH